MKIRIDIDENAKEPEVVIRCRALDDELVRIQTALVKASSESLRLHAARAGEEYYLAPEDVLFFESESGRTWAHTADAAFEVKMRLYELEEVLPHSFIRVSKSAIVGVTHIYSIARNLTGPSVVSFRGSHKKLSASRQYFKVLQDKLNEKRFGGR
jgi:DNA-binding LytR/AlgR family response regulator